MHGQVKTNQQLDERLNFLGLGQEQRQNLSDMKGVITGSLDASLDRFYAKARSVPETAKFFASDAHVQHAKGMQMKHWARIASGTFNSDYTDAVTAIGRTHARLGLEPRWYIGGYALMLDGIVKAVVNSELKGLFQEKKAKKLNDALTVTIKTRPSRHGLFDLRLPRRACRRAAEGRGTTGADEEGAGAGSRTA